jgi:hypothetical protein
MMDEVTHELKYIKSTLRTIAMILLFGLMIMNCVIYVGLDCLIRSLITGELVCISG